MKRTSVLDLGVGQRLPPLELHGEDGVIPLQSSPQRRLATVLFLAHGDGRCDACLEHVNRLAREVDWRDWDGRLLVLMPGGDLAGEEPVHSPARIVRLDADGAATNGSVTAALVIADRYGQVYHSERIGRDHEAGPSPEAVEEWLRFLSTQCPECGVPDVPHGQ